MLRVGKSRVPAPVAQEDTQTLAEVRGLIEAGHVTPVIDFDFPLERTADAVAPLTDGRPAGEVVVTVPA